ncbi:hypothetical protein H0X32_01760 [Patescibacteria group bacterium]|nr:hypothetical protein [Patescibacteria group bacterium]
MASKDSAGNMLPFFSTIDNLVRGSSSNHSLNIRARTLIIAFVILIVTFFILSPSQSLSNFSVLLFLSPIWIPLALIRFTAVRYVQAKRAEFFASQEYVLLELRIPRDTSKTPKSMELFFANMHIGTGETTWWKKFVLGNVRAWWSFEIVSIGGRVHFYIWTRVGFRRLVESYLYAQYPGLEIIEAEDYARVNDPLDADHDLWGCEYALKRPDPYPLKTYVDYEIEPGDKPEETVDPLAQLIELMGAIGPNEQMWLQFIVRQTKTEKWGGMFTTKKNAAGKTYTWKDEADEIIEELREKHSKKNTHVDPATGAMIETQGFPNPTKGMNETIASIERKTGKQGFDVGIRCIYSGTKDAFQGIMVTALINLFKPFNDESRNNIGLASTFGGSFNDYPWEDRGGHRRTFLKGEVLRMYRYRSYYYDPYVGPWMILSSEELATLYHIPSSAVTTPNLPRIQSATAGAPSNLPT